MENGLRTTKSGRIIPAQFVREFRAAVNGKPVLTAQFGRSVATNPQISFRLTGVKAEDTLSLSWEDNLNLKRSDETRIVA
jgi:sulfur-oxidizing protein SoxZ